MRWLVVGANGYGLAYLRALKAAGEHDAEALEPNDLQRKRTVEYVGKRYARASWDDVDGYDVAIVCSRNFDDALHAAKDNAHVCVQAPLAFDLDGRDTLTTALHRDRVGQVSCVWRFHAGMQALRQAVEGGQLGRKFRAESWFSHAVDRWDAPSTGFLLFDRADEFDALRWIMGGDPLGLNAGVYGKQETGPEQVACADIAYPHGRGWLVADSLGTSDLPNVGVRIWGSAGSMPFSPVPTTLDGGKPYPEGYAPGMAVAYQRQVEHWRDAITGATDPVQGFMEAYGVVETIRAAYASAAANQGVMFKAAPEKVPE